MQDNSPQGMKVPLVVSIVAVVVILAGVSVRLLKSPEPEPAAEPVPALAPEPAPVPGPSPEPSPPIKFSSLSATDDNGDNWTLGLAGQPSQPPEEGVKPGAPLSIKADVQGYGQSISIGLIIEGQAGEVYQPGAARNGRRLPAPTFTVFDESDKIVGSGSFEYG